MQRQPNPIITLAIGSVLTAIAVVLMIAGPPRYLVLFVGIGLIVFGLLRLFQQRQR